MTLGLPWLKLVHKAETLARLQATEGLNVPLLAVVLRSVRHSPSVSAVHEAMHGKDTELGSVLQ